MANKRSKPPTDDVGAQETQPAQTQSGGQSLPPTPRSLSPPGHSDLMLSRNKHWKYISQFNGTWQSMDVAVLEQLAHRNYFHMSPRPFDAGLLYDLVRVRRLTDFANDYGVRAATGISAASLINSKNAGKQRFHDSNAAELLGLGYNTRAPTQLTPRIKAEMRHRAVSKLSAAYEIDEIITTVAMMQAASPMDDLPLLVLQQDPQNLEATYTHFFHERIPSRKVVEFTPLTALNRVISAQSSGVAGYRTRAMTRLLKGQYKQAAEDLTVALRLAHRHASEHARGNPQLAKAGSLEEELGPDWREKATVKEEDQPSSLEAQILFHRARTYLSIACIHVPKALGESNELATINMNNTNSFGRTSIADEDEITSEEQLKARKILKVHASRAIKDFLAFLSNLEYTPGYSPEFMSEYVRRVTTQDSPENSSADSFQHPNDIAKQDTGREPGTTAIIPSQRSIPPRGKGPGHFPDLPPPRVFKVSELFAPAPISTESLPPYPPTISEHSKRSSAASNSNPPNVGEAVTYHSFLIEALHSLLLSHCLAQTSPKELLRHANNVARLTRLIGLSRSMILYGSSSPSKIDWVEILRRAKNLIGLDHEYYEELCRHNRKQTWSKVITPPNTSGRNGTEMSHPQGASHAKETYEQKLARLREIAISQTFEDHRVQSDKEMEHAVNLRIQRMLDDEAKLGRELAQLAIGPGEGKPERPDRPPSPGFTPPRSPDESASDALLRTERANLVLQWIKKAPLTVEGVKKKKKRTKPRTTVTGRLTEEDEDSDEVD